MDQACAIASTILFILYAIYTYNVSLRIYNRFWWDKTRTDWRDEVDRVMELNELAPSIDTLREQYGEKKVEQALKVSLHRGYLNDSSTEQQRRSVISNMLSLMYNPKQQSKSPKNNVNASKDTSATPSERGSERLDPSHPYFDAESVISDSPYMEINSGSELVTFADNSSATGPQIADLKAGGYLTMKHKAKGLSMKDPWERRYFIIKNDCVYYYKDRRSFDLEPSKPLNIRPIDLEGYTLYADSEAPPYLLSLVPSSEEDIRKTWVFRADTLAEFRSWKEIFSKALESANAKQH